MSFTVSYTGQANTAGDTRAIHMELWANEVMIGFERHSVTRGNHFLKTVDSGKSHQFDEVWKTSAAVHTPGALLSPTAISHGKRNIVIDKMLVSPVFLDVEDVALAEHDYTSAYTQETGIALAEIYDKHNLRNLWAAAHEGTGTGQTAIANPALVEGGKEGHLVAAATGKTDRDVLFAAIQTAAQFLDEADVMDKDDRFIYLRPAEYYLLISLGTNYVDNPLVNRDIGGEGSVVRSDIKVAANMSIVKANNWNDLVGVDEGSVSDLNPYAQDFQLAICVGGTKDATGVVEVIGVRSESEYQIERQGTLVVSKMLNGFGVLRPESAFAIKTALV